MFASKKEDVYVSWDYSNSVWKSLTNRVWNVWREAMIDTTLSTSIQNEEEGTNDSEINKYGFRSNTSKNSANRQQRRASLIPWTTYFLLLVNIGLYLLYWQRQVPLSVVALNSQLLLGDLGRSLTGNLAHFEIWHLGVNMMSTYALGNEMSLERSLGTIPLFLLTVSWIPLMTMIVVVLQLFKTMLCSRDAISLSLASDMMSTFPNMVGFSGILFAWMVVATLQTQQKSCPVFFMPDLCFDVYEIGGFSVSLGPIVQLVVLQVILPRASFMGHLAGIVLGFLFHWKVQPPLEWIQPCMLFPLLWFVGKYLSLKYFEPAFANGCANGGGRVLGSGSTGITAVPWKTTIQENLTNQEDDKSAAVWSLSLLRTTLVLHSALLLCTSFRRHLINSMIISELFCAAFLTAIENACRGRVSKVFSQDFTVGMLGRASVVMLIVQCITDSMTLAGWLVTSPLWQSSVYWFPLLTLWMLRIALWVVSLCVVCQVLNLKEEIQQHHGPSAVWTRALSWWVVKPCIVAGKRIVTMLGNRNLPINSSSVDGNNGLSQTHHEESTSTSEVLVLRGRFVSEAV
ncbi:rhomboid family protein [Nitzschia inconspicua]|uniref:Rhomboid family protein n=1 Tax=Nitzschia inconspicua TaxID=303405 RepID=A0A9K3KIB0_9STRA|nr:rhomboid family protein [Nitzschia inconspicua]